MTMHHLWAQWCGGKRPRFRLRRRGCSRWHWLAIQPDPPSLSSFCFSIYKMGTIMPALSITENCRDDHTHVWERFVKWKLVYKCHYACRSHFLHSIICTALLWWESCSATQKAKLPREPKILLPPDYFYVTNSWWLSGERGTWHGI